MKYAIGPRREIGIRTVFNILGPLTNPAGANVYLLGAYAEELIDKIAGALNNFGVKRALVVWGEGNIDELTTTGVTKVCEVRDGKLQNYTVTPEELGLSRVTLAEIKGGQTAAESAVQVREVLSGVPGPRRDMVLLNAGAALMAAGRADGIKEGIDLAAKVIDSGAALAKLEALVAFCRG